MNDADDQKELAAQQELEQLKKRIEERERQFQEDYAALKEEQIKFGLAEHFSGGTSFRLSVNKSRELQKLLR